MAEETNPSAGGSVTPTPTTPVIGTPASSGVTPPAKLAPTVEELLRKQEELEQSLKNAREAEDRLGKKLSVHEKAQKDREALEQAAKDAQLSEIERVKKQHADAEARIKQQQQQLVMAQIKLVAKDKGILNSELIAPFVERKLEYDKDGEPTNLEAVLDEIIKGNPNLVAKPAEPAQTAPTQTAPAVPVNHPSRSGRSDIPSAGTLPTGKPFTLNDYEWKR